MTTLQMLNKMNELCRMYFGQDLDDETIEWAIELKAKHGAKTVLKIYVGTCTDAME